MNNDIASRLRKITDAGLAIYRKRVAVTCKTRTIDDVVVENPNYAAAVRCLEAPPRNADPLISPHGAARLNQPSCNPRRAILDEQYAESRATAGQRWTSNNDHRKS